MPHPRLPLLRTLGWALALALTAPLALGVAPPPEALELPEVVVRGIDRVRLEAEREGVLALEAPRIAQTPLSVELPAETLPHPSLGEAPPVQTPGCAYRNPVTGALARATGGAESLYKSAMERLSRDLLGEASGFLAQLRSEYPGSPLAGNAAFWLGEIRRREGRLDDAVAFFGLTEGEYAEEAAYRRAALLEELGRETEARRTWERLAGDPASPHRPEALYRLGASYLRTGQPREALGSLETLGELSEQGKAVRRDVQAAGLFALGLARRRVGDLAGAEKALVRFLLESPDHPEAPPAQAALGWTLLEQGRAREAAQRFLWLSEARPPESLLVRALYGRVRALTEEGSPEAPDALLALEAAAPAGPWAGWARADLAWAAFRRGAYADALERYRAALAVWDAPAREVSQYMVGECLYLLGRYGEASEAYGAVPAAAPLGPAALHRAGLCALLAGDAEAAERSLSRALERDPAYPEADRVWAWLGEARLRLGRPEEALRAFNAVPEGSPAFPQALYGRAWIAFEAERWDEAAGLFARLVRNHPGDPNRDEARLMLARAYFNRREVRPAIEALEQLEAEARTPGYRSAARFYRGWMYARSEREKQAREVLGALLAEEPRGEFAARALQTLAWLDFGAGDYGGALARFDAILAMAPGGELEAEARRKRADSLYNLGRHEEALAAYQQLGDTPEGRYGEALCLLGLGRLGELGRAADRFAKAYPRDPRSTDLFFSLAQARAEGGDWPGAAHAYLRAAELGTDEKAAEARLEAARSLASGNDDDGAAKLLEPLSSRADPVGLAALRELGRLLDRRGPPETARGVWDRLAARTEGTERAEVLRAAARSAAALLDWEGAEGRLRAALEACPESAPLLRQALLADLGETFLLQGAPGRAVEPLSEAAELALSPEGLRAFLAMGKAQEAATREQEALETYLRIGYLYPVAEPGVAGALLRAGEILRGQGDVGRARAVYQKVADEAPEETAGRATQALGELGVPPAPDQPR